MSAPILRDRWLTPAGGLVYHLRALRHRPLWRAYSDRLAGWLQAWNPPCRELVLIGPSAGWTLPAAFLAGFGQVHVLEPDPLARRLLGRRFADTKLVFDRLDCLCDRDGPARLAGMTELQRFLERGFDTFQAMRGAQPFLDAVVEREDAFAAEQFAAQV